jgi:hypothetical protein
MSEKSSARGDRRRGFQCLTDKFDRFQSPFRGFVRKRDHEKEKPPPKPRRVRRLSLPGRGSKMFAKVLRQLCWRIFGRGAHGLWQGKRRVKHSVFQTEINAPQFAVRLSAVKAVFVYFLLLSIEASGMNVRIAYPYPPCRTPALKNPRMNRESLLLNRSVRTVHVRSFVSRNADLLCGSCRTG